MEILDGKKQLELPDSFKAAALKAELMKGWTLDDVPEDHDLTDAQAKDMWALFECAISDAVAADKALSTPALPVLSATDMKRAKMWFVARTVQVDDVLDEVPNKTLPEGERALLAEDLKAMRMESPASLYWFLLSRHTGRPVTMGACAGATYRTPPGEMPGGVIHRKSKGRNFDEVLADGLASGDSSEYDAWIATLSERFESCAHPFAAGAA